MSLSPVNANPITTGELKKVADPAFDFRKPVVIASNMQTAEEGFDHNFVLDKPGNEFGLAASLVAPGNSMQLLVYITEPGLQLYTGNMLDGSFKNRDSKPMFKHSALCLETQHCPDSPNQPNFPSTILMPGTKYFSKTVYKVNEI